ncbi:MAG: 1-acyl-sn-glycerol-3-phosphate acyltransferase [Firmicutes bacterium ADurb.Bin356]|nr:MAG: 1-acyl-sn-glycerol-3-phosphate acyltransferase [Firmicutes bacterium ADurb.Bin356]
MLYILIKYLLLPIVGLIMRPIVMGKENLLIRGKAIFVCNHISMWDPVMMAMVSPRYIHFMAKAELFQGWLGNLFFRALFAFPVSRKHSDLGSVRNAMQVLEKGKVFGIFPEGKRTITDDLDDLEKGAAFLAIRSGAPVVPMYIRRDSFKKCRLVMAVGSPIFVGDIIASTPKSKLLDVFTDEISDAIHALQTKVEAR